VRFAFVSNGGDSLAWQVRLLSEGHEVCTWITEKDYKQAGDGIVPKADSFAELESWANKDAKTVYVFDMTGKGKLADSLRKQGKLVFGGGHFNDTLEDDRAKAAQIANMLGIKTPPTVPVASLDAAIAHMKKQPEDEKWYFKPSDPEAESNETYSGTREPMVAMLEHYKATIGNMKGIMQKAIDGVGLDLSWWWNGSKILGFIGLIEYKAVANDDLGPATGSATSLMWRFENDMPLMARKIDIKLMEDFFKKMNLCPGEFGFNAIISAKDKRPYFLEWDPRLGYDASMVYLPGLERGLGESIAACAAGILEELPLKKGEYWGGIRYVTTPWPVEVADGDSHSSQDLPVFGITDLSGEEFSPYSIKALPDGKLQISSKWGNVGCVVAEGRTLDEVVKEVYARCKKILVPDGFYRTDFGKHEKEDLRKLKGWGYLG
jgi:phosphoribosylamine---glycine ligase